MMAPRITLPQLPAGMLDGLLQTERYLSATGLGADLLEQVRLRASLLNQCAYCIDMHFKEAAAAGVDAQRLYSLAAWQETPYYSPRERAALRWTDAVSQPALGQVADGVYETACAEFEPALLAQLTLAVAQINAWNRLALALRFEPGSYTVTGSQ